MAKKIDKIIISPNAPKSKNVGWFNGKELKIPNDGTWGSVGGSSNNNGQIYTLPPQLMELFKNIEMEGERASVLSLKDAETFFKESWNTVFKKFSEYTFIIYPPYIPTYYYNTFALGAPLEESIIHLMFYSSERTELNMTITSSQAALEKDGEKYVMFLLTPNE